MLSSNIMNSKPEATPATSKEATNESISSKPWVQFSLAVVPMVAFALMFPVVIDGDIREKNTTLSDLPYHAEEYYSKLFSFDSHDLKKISLGTWFQLALAVSPVLFGLISPMLHELGFWGKRHFQAHRIGGFIWLFQYMYAWFVFLTDYEAYETSTLPFSVPISGLWQVCSALYYFRFLPKKKGMDPGFFSDKGILSYTFVQENLFFALIQVFGTIYHSQKGFGLFRSAINGGFSLADGFSFNENGLLAAAFMALEATFVFLPFQVLRRFFPKTSISVAEKNRDRNTTEGNKLFYKVSSMAIKVFYLCAKHFMGGLLQHLRFLECFSKQDDYWLNFMLLASGGTLYVAVFMHTLRFKKLINPRSGFLIYLGYWVLTTLPLLHLGHVFVMRPYISMLSVVSLLLNFSRKPLLQGAYQWALLGLFWAHRLGLLDVL